MYKTSKETQIRKDAKRKQIMDTAAKVFAERGYHNTSVKEIVDAAGVSVGSFYFYFKGKEELFAELYTEISKEFDEMTLKVIDIKNFSVAKNYTRAITVNLWMYQQRRELTKLMFVEAAGLNPQFAKRCWEAMKLSSETMAERFRSLKNGKSKVNIPDERVAALAFNGTFYYLVLDWADGDENAALTDHACALSIYNLQALRLSFEDEEIKGYVEELLEELNQ